MGGVHFPSYVHRIETRVDLGRADVDGIFSLRGLTGSARTGDGVMVLARLVTRQYVHYRSSGDSELLAEVVDRDTEGTTIINSLADVGGELTIRCTAVIKSKGFPTKY